MKLYKIFLVASLSIVCLSIQNQAVAQYNLPGLYMYRNDIINTSYNPALLDLKNKRFQMSIGSYYGWGGTTIGTYNTLVSVLDKSVSAEERTKNLKELISNLGSRNLIASGIESAPLYFAFRPVADKPLNIQLGVRFQAGAAAQFSDLLGKLVFEGNKQFQNQVKDFGENMFLRAHAVAEYTVGASYTKIEIGDMELGVGGQIKLMQGLGSLDTDIRKFEVYNSIERVEARYDYDIRIAGLDTDDKFKVTSGLGVGGDLGATLRFQEKFEVGLSLTNLGFVGYGSNIVTYTVNDSIAYDFQGVKLDNFLEKNDDVKTQFVPDTLLSLLDPEKHGNKVRGQSFSVGTGPRVMLHAVFEPAGRTDDKNDNDYAPHSIYATYIQGTSTRLSSIDRPFVGLGYTFNLKNLVLFNASASFGGMNGAAVGAAVGLNTFNNFKLSIGTTNLLAMFGSGRVADIGFNLMLGF